MHIKVSKYVATACFLYLWKKPWGKIRLQTLGRLRLIVNKVKQLPGEIQITRYKQQTHRHVDIVYNVFMKHLESGKRGRCFGGCCIIKELVEHSRGCRDETVDVVLTSYRHDGLSRSLAFMQPSAVNAFSIVLSLASVRTAANSLD